MKLRLQEDALQLRLSREEIAALAAHGRLGGRTPLGPGQALVYAVVASPAATELTLSWADGALTVALPADEVAAWPGSGRIGFARDLDVGDGLMLNVRVEWDFKGEQRPERKEQRRKAMEEAYVGAEREELEDRASERDELGD